LLSHVPRARFDAFWSLVVYGEESAVIERRLNDGNAYRIVKVPLEPASLEARLRQIG